MQKKFKYRIVEINGLQVDLYYSFRIFFRKLCIYHYYLLSLNTCIGYVQLNTLHVYYMSESFVQQLEITS